MVAGVMDVPEWRRANDEVSALESVPKGADSSVFPGQVCFLGAAALTDASNSLLIDQSSCAWKTHGPIDRVQAEFTMQGSDTDQ